MEKDDNRVVIRRRIQATREELFDAWTDPDGMKEWMCPGDTQSAEIEMDVRVGGKLLIVMRGPAELFEHRGEFTLVERPAKLAFSWASRATDWRPTLVTVEIFEINENESELVLTHENLPSSEARDRHREGWCQVITLMEPSIRRRLS